MPKKFGVLFVILGAVLLGSALLLLAYNELESYRAGQSAEMLIDQLQAQIQPKPQTPEVDPSQDPTSDETIPEETLDPEMPVLMVDGFEYIGYLSIPVLELELPVMAEWDYKRLQYAPCRQNGSTRTDDLVIAAHNYRTHFGRLVDLEPGTDVYFTDVDGIENHYQLLRVETVSPDSVDAVLNSGCDLVLYTCTPGGATRVVAFLDRA